MKALLLIFLGGIAVMFAGLGKKETKTLPYVLMILSVALAFVFYDFTAKPSTWELKFVPQFMMEFSLEGLPFEGILILATFLIFGLFSQKETVGADLQALMLFSLCGGILLASFTNMVMLFLGLEVMSIPLYVLAGSRKHDLRSNEAAIKYFLMGAFSTVVFLIGTALLYGATGALDRMTIMGRLNGMVHTGVPTMVTVGITFIIAGLGFKIAAVPFHFWSPDVYEGSPNRTTVFMAVVVKIAAFSAIFRIVSIGFVFLRAEFWGPILGVIAALTILVGNIAALRQQNVKRTLAYSSVAHSGYMLLGIIALPENGFWGLLLYSVAYAVANISIFFLFNKVSANGDESFDAFNGFGKANRFAGLALAIAIFSMAGIPVTAGFAAKYTVFTAAFAENKWVVIVALIGSAISIAYYFRIFKSAFFHTESDGVALETNLREKFMLLLSIAIILVLGIMPSLITRYQFF